jgi:hypothetical protein
MIKFILTDYSRREYGRDRNGGAYSYSEVVELDDAGNIVGGHYETSAEFQFCRFCGSFGCAGECDYAAQDFEPSADMKRALTLYKGGTSAEEINKLFDMDNLCVYIEGE